MRFYEIQNLASNTYQVLLSDLPHDPRLEIIFTLMSAFGPISELELFHTVDSEEAMKTYCQVHYESREAVRLAVSYGSITYKGHQVAIEAIQEIMTSSAPEEVSEVEKPLVSNLLEQEDKDSESTSSQRLFKWSESKISQFEKDAKVGTQIFSHIKFCGMAEMLQETVRSEEYRSAQRLHQHEENCVVFRKEVRTHF